MRALFGRAIAGGEERGARKAGLLTSALPPNADILGIVAKGLLLTQNGHLVISTFRRRFSFNPGLFHPSRRSIALLYEILPLFTDPDQTCHMLHKLSVIVSLNNDID